MAGSGREKLNSKVVWPTAHLCGGTDSQIRLAHHVEGLSPRGRGNHGDKKCLPAWRRSIPAWLDFVSRRICRHPYSRHGPAGGSKRRGPRRCVCAPVIRLDIMDGGDGGCAVGGGLGFVGIPPYLVRQAQFPFPGELKNCANLRNSRIRNCPTAGWTPETVAAGRGKRPERGWPSCTGRPGALPGMSRKSRSHRRLRRHPPRVLRRLSGILRPGGPAMAGGGRSDRKGPGQPPVPCWPACIG